ncbi:MAG: hypothetical protein ACR2N5_04255, partial [Solirubrobacterales bacterium]
MGLVDPWTLQHGLNGPTGDTNPAARLPWLDRARQARAKILFMGAVWTQIAPADPSPSFDPRNPADPEYDWSSMDGAIRDVTSRGFEPMILVAHAPSWIEGPGRPAGGDLPAGPNDTANAPFGTWKPRT